jgi:hypothetical protein
VDEAETRPRTPFYERPLELGDDPHGAKGWKPWKQPQRYVRWYRMTEQHTRHVRQASVVARFAAGPIAASAPAWTHRQGQR